MSLKGIGQKLNPIDFIFDTMWKHIRIKKAFRQEIESLLIFEFIILGIKHWENPGE